MKSFSLRTFLLFPFFILVLQACGSEGAKKDLLVDVASVSINPSNAEMEIGSTLALTAQVYPSNATNSSVSWTSSNSKIASVSSAGIVTAITQGNVIIRATAGEQYADCSIKVLNKKDEVPPELVIHNKEINVYGGRRVTVKNNQLYVGTVLVASGSDNVTPVLSWQLKFKPENNESMEIRVEDVVSAKGILTISIADEAGNQSSAEVKFIHSNTEPINGANDPYIGW